MKTAFTEGFQRIFKLTSYTIDLAASVATRPDTRANA